MVTEKDSLALLKQITQQNFVSKFRDNSKVGPFLKIVIDQLVGEDKQFLHEYTFKLGNAESRKCGKLH